MNFVETPLPGAFIIEPEPYNDERGFFARIWDTKEFREKGLDDKIVQCSISHNFKKGTLRGMHYQLSPHEETKLVRCTRGNFYGVILDLRKDSKTYKKWYGFELSEDNYKMIYVPKGLASGYQTLVDNTSVAYQISEFHMPELYRGIRWDDPAFNINWPLEVTVISNQDKSWELWHD